MKLLIDMNLTPRWVDTFTQAGIDSVRWSSVGPVTAPDEVILEYARTHGFHLLTHDLDFSAILAATAGTTPSVIQNRGRKVTPEEIGKAVIDAARQMQAELAAGALLSVDTRRLRLRLLPLNTP